MNILLIYPEFPDTFWSFKHAVRFIKKRASFPPLGLLTVASMLPSEWNKRLVDVNVRKLKKSDLKWADYAFISAMDIQRKSTREIISRCRETGLKVVAGGPLFTNEPEEFSDVDHLVLNEAELTLNPFLEDLKKGCAKPIYSTNEFADLQGTPAPMWELAELNRYASMSIQYSRGCPFNCDFCNVTVLFGHKPRIKKPEQIIKELENLHTLGWRGSVFFVDDNLIGNKKSLKTELIPSLIEWQKKRKFPFNCEVSINIADDPNLMHSMYEAGFDTVFIGIESPEDGNLAECSKRQNLNRNLIEDVKKIQHEGLQVQGGFIVGFDNDTPATFQRLIDFIQNSGIVTAMVGILQAPPGTRLYERMKMEGRLSGHTSGDNADGTTNLITKMNLDSLKDGYKNLMKRLYSPKHFFKRAKTFLREYKPPKVSIKPNYDHIHAFLSSILHIGILSRGRLHYWKFLTWVFFCRPQLFPLAISISIYGYHFHRISLLI